MKWIARIVFPLVMLGAVFVMGWARVILEVKGRGIAPMPAGAAADYLIAGSGVVQYDANTLRIFRRLFRIALPKRLCVPVYRIWRREQIRKARWVAAT